MFSPFDIFLTEAGCSVRSLEAAATLEDAKARVQELAVRSPGGYLILSQKTGTTLTINFDGVDEAPGP